MNLKYIIIILNLCLTVFSFQALTDNEGTQKIGSFDNWSVYAKSKNLCYMVAQPEKSEGKYKLRGRVRIVIYRNNLENQDENALGIDFGYTFPENSKAKIEIDDKKKFKLATFGQTAWTGSKTKQDKKIIKAMLKGTPIDLHPQKI